LKYLNNQSAMIRFKTKRLLARDVEEKDYIFLLSIYSQKENMKYISSGKYDWTLTELKEKYQIANKDYSTGIGIFIVQMKDSGIIIGEAGLFNSFNDPLILELGYIIDSDFWRQGFGSEICSGLIKYAFNTLGAHKVVARMYADNIGSVRLSEKLGMQRTESGETQTGAIFYRYELENNLNS